jgi:hypothetical protein
VAALPPAGFGTLRQDDISMVMRQRRTRDQVATTGRSDPQLARDTYARLHAVHSDDWRRILIRLEQERARVSTPSH